MTKFFALSILLVLLSCSKERNLHLTAKNAVTGAPYAGLNYYVVEEKEGNNGTDYTTVATGTLDSNGEKVVPVKIRKNRSYVIRLDPPPNWCYMNEVSYSYTIHDEKSPTFDFTFAECAYLKFRYNNTFCQGTSDHIEVTRVTNLPGYVGFYNPATYDGCTDYVMPDFVQVPMGYWYFSWVVTKNGITNSYSDTIFLNAGEQKYYEFNY